jgi:hypothetical protein
MSTYEFAYTVILLYGEESERAGLGWNEKHEYNNGKMIKY